MVAPRIYAEWGGRYAESEADFEARKEGYASNYQRQHALAIKAYMAGDDSLIKEFDAKYPAPSRLGRTLPKQSNNAR